MRITRCTGTTIIVALMISSECYSANILSYPWSSSGLIKDQDRAFSVYVHGKENSILIQPRMINIFKQDASKWPIAIWRHAAETFVSPIGCGISDVRAVTRMGSTWEANYVCPEGVDLKFIARSERTLLLKGEPLRPIKIGKSINSPDATSNSLTDPTPFDGNVSSEIPK